MTNFLIGSALFFAAGLTVIFVPEKLKSLTFLLFSVAAQFFILPDCFKILMDGGSLVSVVTLTGPVGPAALRLDPLSAFFASFISIGSLLAAVYSAGYMKQYINTKYSLSEYYFFLGLLSASMLLIVTVQNALLFLMIWELMSVSSFFLVGFENNKEDVRKASLYYLIAMQIGASFLIAAFALTANLSGSLDFSSFPAAFHNGGFVPVLIIILFFIGFGTKAGFFPFHTWLPKAHPAAPTGVSALMSGVMIKTGIYGILRIILLSGISDKILAYSIFSVSLVTGIIGIANSISQNDMKKSLAYSSIENIGIIGMAVGLGMLGMAYNLPVISALGFLAALLHTLNHFTFKSLLFFGTGTVYQKTHTRNIDELGGLVKYMPATSAFFFIGAAAISGLPLLNGFVSEFILYVGLAKGISSQYLPINIITIIGFSGLALIGSAALLGFTRLYGITFLGLPRRQYNSNVRETDILSLLPSAVLAACVLLTGIFPVILIKITGHVLAQFDTGLDSRAVDSILSMFYGLSLAFAYFASAIVILSGIRFLLLRKRKVSVFKTWDCGYQEPNGRMQYTGSSFSLSFLNLISSIVPLKSDIKGNTGLFPGKMELKSSANDITELFIIRPSLRFLRNVFNSLSWIQSGKMQQYILYGLIFLFIILLWVIGVM